MSFPEEVIVRRWLTAGGGELWGTKGTYTAIEYSRLPPLPQTRAPFDWLSALPVRHYSCTLDSDENCTAGLASVRAEVRSLGFQLPEDFEMFITRPDIQAQTPSCTGCFLQLSDSVTPLPGFSGNFAVRFMNDSQNCILWYLLFQPDKPVRVLANDCFIERDLFDMMEYQTSQGEPLQYEDVLRNSCICAESFSDFIFRFCMENAIWFATHEKHSLSPFELEYLHSAKRKA